MKIWWFVIVISKERCYIDDDAIMFVYLVWSHYDHGQCWVWAPGQLATATAAAARSPHNICRSSAVPGSGLAERVRTQGKLTVETWKIGSEEKKRPLTLLIMVCTLSIQDTGPPIVASFQAGPCNLRPQLNGSKLFLRIDHGLTLQWTINILKLAKRQTKNSIFINLLHVIQMIARALALTRKERKHNIS